MRRSTSSPGRDRVRERRRIRSDGGWTVAPRERAVQDAHPGLSADRRRSFNGTVVVEWLNVSGGLDAAPDWTTAHTELIREGYAWVGVSAQLVGVEGGGAAIPGLPTSASRARTRSATGRSAIPATASRTTCSRRRPGDPSPGGVDPLGGLTLERLIAAGESQSAFRLVTYVNAIHPLTRVYDGFLIHSRGGGGAPLSQTPQPAIAMPRSARIRSDLDVPVLIFETETDLITLGCPGAPARQRRSSASGRWPEPRTPTRYTLVVGCRDLGDSPDAAKVLVTTKPIPGIIECSQPINSGPQHCVLNAAFAALDRWVAAAARRRRRRACRSAGRRPLRPRRRTATSRGGIRTP